MTAHPGLDRLVEVMRALRAGCPWDARQTHRSLVHYLVEETLEVVEAIEDGSDEALREELGDLLLQVVFHAEIAAEEGRFDIDAVASGIADKLVARHPYVFSDSAVPEDLMGSWEQRKRAEKGRSSALDGIPNRMSALARANKVVARARYHGLDVDALLVDRPDDVGRACWGSWRRRRPMRSIPTRRCGTPSARWRPRSPRRKRSHTRGCDRVRLSRRGTGVRACR